MARSGLSTNTSSKFREVAMATHHVVYIADAMDGLIDNMGVSWQHMLLSDLQCWTAV